jgi:hypothetical protein
VVRPTQAQIYRRRRIFLVFAIALAVIVVWLSTSAIAQLAQPSEQEARPGGDSGSLSTGAATADFPPCDPAQIDLIAKVGDETGARESFGADVIPLVWYEIVSNADSPCTFNVGSSVTFFTITSGEETIWSSRQCDRSGDAELLALLEPGVSKRSQGSQWLRVRSSQSGGCGAGQPAVVAGGASYHLRVEVNGVISQNKQQFLLY